MRQLMTAAVIGGLAAAAASGQFRAPSWGDDDRWERQRRSPVRGDVVARVLGDLDRMRSYRRVDHHERKHFENARKDLLRFRDRWADGRFDRGRLDSAIDNLRHLVDSAQVHPRDREILARDLYALRDFRSYGGEYEYGRRRSGPGW
jgi:hypothetical protein